MKLEALVFFLMHVKIFPKAEKATVSITFGELWFVLVLGPLDLWTSGPRANEGREFDLHMNNILKNH